MKKLRAAAAMELCHIAGALCREVRGLPSPEAHPDWMRRSIKISVCADTESFFLGGKDGKLWEQVVRTGTI